MIKVTYYVGTRDKDTCENELSCREFFKVFDELFINYTLQKAQGVYTMKDTGRTVKEFTFIVTTLVDEDDIKTTNRLKIKILNNVEKMKDVLNQETILVEISKPEIIFL